MTPDVDTAPPGIDYRTGDATRPHGHGRRLIVHVNNDRGGWGRGFAVALSRRWAAPEARYRQWHRSGRATCPITGRQAPFELGEILPVVVEPGLAVVNLVGQHDTVPGPDGSPPVRYQAIRQGLVRVRELAEATGASVHAPRFGAGLAGGDWSRIEALICDELVDHGIDVVVYDLPGTTPPTS